MIPRCARCGLIFLRTDDYLQHRCCRPTGVPPTTATDRPALTIRMLRAIAEGHPSVAPGESRRPVERRAPGSFRRGPGGSFYQGPA